MDEEDIWLEVVETLQELLELCLLIEEAEFVEVGDPGLEECCIVFDGLFELLSGEGVLEQSMIHDEIVNLNCVFLSLLPLKLESA